MYIVGLAKKAGINWKGYPLFDTELTMCDISILSGARLGGSTGNHFVHGNGKDTGYRLSLTAARRIVDEAGHDTGFFVGGITSSEILSSDGKPTGLVLGGRSGRQVIAK